MQNRIANVNIGLLLLRLFVGLRLVYGVIDNVISWEKMLEFSKFLHDNQFPIPTMTAVVSVYVQLIGGLCILIGFKTRLASLFLIFNFCVALIFFHFRIDDTIEGMTPALAMLFGCLTLLFTGAGKYGVEREAQ